MGLIKCHECGNEISDKAVSCPSCGCPIQSTTQAPYGQAQVKPQKKGHGCLVFLLVFFLFCGGMGFLIQTISGSSDGNVAESTLSKAAATELDTEVWADTVEVIKVNNDLLHAMSGYADGSISELDAYDYCKEANTYLASTWSAFPTSSDNNANKYISSCKDYTLVVQSLAKSLQKYIDLKETSDLSKLKEDIERANQAISIASGNRGLFLQKAGYTDEELKELADKIDAELGEKSTE